MAYNRSDNPLMPRPKVLLLITLAEVGGAQAYVASLLPVLVERFDVVVAAHGPGPLRTAAEEAGVRFVALRHVRRPISPWRDLAGFLELVRLLRRERPDILHASSSKAGVLGRLAAGGHRRPDPDLHRARLGVRRHTGTPSLLYRWVDRLVSRLTSVTICVSENDRLAGLRARTCSADRTIVIRNGVSVEAAPRARHERGRPLLLSVGRFKAPKDFITLARALAILPASSFEALIVGDGPERPALEAELRRLGIDDRVRLAGEQSDVRALLADADAFVLSSRSEGLPVSILEAMAAELPVVASRVGGVPELVVDGENGFLVPPGDPRELAAALERLVDDPDLAAAPRRRRAGARGDALQPQRFPARTSRALCRGARPTPAPGSVTRRRPRQALTMETAYRLAARNPIEAVVRTLALAGGAAVLLALFLASGVLLSRNPLPLAVVLAIGIGLLATLFAGDRTL